MRLCKWPVAIAAMLAALLQHASDPARAESAGGVRVRVSPLKNPLDEGKAGDGPVMAGPQTALELEWRLLNDTGDTLDIPSPGSILRMRVTGPDGTIPVRTEWASEMMLRSTIAGRFDATKVPAGVATLTDGAAVWVHGSTKRLDGDPFAPGNYVLELDVVNIPVPRGGRPVSSIDRGYPIKLTIAALDSPQRQLEFHRIEAAFYKERDKARALEHLLALTSLPGSYWGDQLGLAWLYGDLGRHREACAVFRPILPEIIRGLDNHTFRGSMTVHLRRAATCFAVEGDVATATHLLKLEGRTPPDRIPAEIEQLRKSALNQK